MTIWFYEDYADSNCMSEHRGLHRSHGLCSIGVPAVLGVGHIWLFAFRLTQELVERDSTSATKRIRLFGCNAVSFLLRISNSDPDKSTWHFVMSEILLKS